MFSLPPLDGKAPPGQDGVYDAAVQYLGRYWGMAVWAASSLSSGDRVVISERSGWPTGDRLDRRSWSFPIISPTSPPVYPGCPARIARFWPRPWGYGLSFLSPNRWICPAWGHDVDSDPRFRMIIPRPCMVGSWKSVFVPHPFIIRNRLFQQAVNSAVYTVEFPLRNST